MPYINLKIFFYFSHDKYILIGFKMRILNTSTILCPKWYEIKSSMHGIYIFESFNLNYII